MARLDADPLARITAEGAQLAACIAELEGHLAAVEAQLTAARRLRSELLVAADMLNRGRLRPNMAPPGGPVAHPHFNSG
jgi:hypothetical protein